MPGDGHARGLCDCPMCVGLLLDRDPVRPSDEEVAALEKYKEEAESLLAQIEAAVIVPGEMFERFVRGFPEPLSSANDESYGMGC